MDGSRLTVVIPAYNEARTIAGVVAAATPHAHVLVVDDGSGDDTARLAEAAGATVHRAESNLGYDGALAAGVTRAFAEGAEAVVTMDADGEHDPAILSRFAEALGRLLVRQASGRRLVDDRLVGVDDVAPGGDVRDLQRARRLERIVCGDQGLHGRIRDSVLVTGRRRRRALPRG